MVVVSIDQSELEFIELFRIALSEETMDRRRAAINNVKHDIIAQRLDLLSFGGRTEWMSAPENAELVAWIAKTAYQRHEAILEFAQTSRAFEDKMERKLNIAEHIGFSVFLSIREDKFEGLHTVGGILEQVREQAKRDSVSGARDIDTLREIWKMYRGVVHLGMAHSYSEDYPMQDLDMLHLAEEFRKSLSENCPKGTSRPYVDPDEQISFVYKSRISGPRFQNRGLSFEID